MAKFKKTISIIIFSGLLLSCFSYYSITPVYATDGGGGYASAAAGWAHFAKYVLKEFILDLAARLTARLQLTSALNGIAQQVIQSGRTGRAPAFIQNWRNFITEAEYRGEDVFRSILANTENCPYIKRDILNMFGVRASTPITQNIRVGNLDSYQVRGRCTMPRGWTIQNYNRDFSGNGGWDALARLADPQNNFYGSTIIAMGELHAQRNLDRSADRAEAGANGFTGVRKSSRTGNSCDTPPVGVGQCTSVDGSIGSGIRCISDRDCSSSANSATPVCSGGGVLNSQARCTFLGNITTPSKILGEGAAEFIDSNLKWLTTSDEISEILGNFIQTMIGKLADYTANAIAPRDVAEPQKSGYEACVRQCNNGSVGSQNTLCIDRCYKQSGVDLPNSYDSSNFTSSTPTPTPNSCVPAEGNYAGQVGSAIANVVANTTLDDGSRASDADLSAFLDALVLELRNMGLRAGRIDNGRLRADTVIVGNNSDLFGHVYDVVFSSCAAGRIGDNLVGDQCMGQDGNWSILREPGGISSICVATPTPTPTILPNTACTDGIDNDLDSLIDFAGGPSGEPADPDCNGDPNTSTEGLVIP